MKYKNKISIQAMAMEDRPREKFIAQGSDHLTNSELLAILLNTGTRENSALDLAKRLLEKFNNNLDELGKADVSTLQEIHGVGQAKAIKLLASLELGKRRIYRNPEDEKLKVVSSQIAFRLVASDLLDKPKEELWGLFLNRANKLIAKKKLSEGGIGSTIMDPKVIFHEAVSMRSSSIILAHNHPSGNLQPSTADIESTKKIKEGARLLEIALLDHLIIAGGAYTSLSDEGLM
jgi:DNA repair protein RadC